MSLNPQEAPATMLGTLAGLGAFIGLGKLLASDEPLTVRLVIGRMIATAGVAMAAGATTLLFPQANPIVLLGVGAALASLGASALEVFLKKKMGVPE